MTTAPASLHPRPAQRQGSASSPPSTITAIDPIKLLKKHLLLLIISGIVGIGAGVVAHVLFSKFAPKYHAYARFECKTPNDDIAKILPGLTNDKEFERFMQTQAQFMISESVLDRVANDPRLQREAPNWSKMFVENGRFNAVEAKLELEEIARARVIRNTTLVEVGASWREPADVRGIVFLIRDTYYRQYLQHLNAGTADQRDELQRLINDKQEDLRALQTRRERIIRDEDIDSLDIKVSEAQQNLSILTEEGNKNRMEIEAASASLKRYEQDIQNPAGLTYDDTITSEVNSGPIVGSMRQQISQLNTEIAALTARGFGEAHRDVRALRTRLDAAKQSLESMREKELRSAFESRVEGVRQALAQLRAQEADLIERLERTQLRNNELTRVATELDDISRSIELNQNSLSSAQVRLDDLEAISRSNKVVRVSLQQQERTPDEPSFPKIQVMIPAGFIAVLGLVGGIVITRELLDQRVKGASDINIIPRARVIGIIPDSSEDPSNPKLPERALLDNPDSVLAETYRQVRSTILKRLDNAGHHTLLVTSGMPRSGTSSVIANLGVAIAGSERRVLLVDANLRRPSLHTIFETESTPGLADILAQEVSLDNAIHQTSVEGLEILPCGNPEFCQYERIAGERASTLLATVAADYDIVLIDSAPAIVSGDSAALAARCDAVMLVVRAMSEKRGLVARLTGEFADARSEFLGVLVNCVRSSAGGYMRRNIQATHSYQSNKG